MNFIRRLNRGNVCPSSQVFFRFGDLFGLWKLVTISVQNFSSISQNYACQAKIKTGTWDVNTTIVHSQLMSVTVKIS